MNNLGISSLAVGKGSGLAGLLASLIGAISAEALTGNSLIVLIVSTISAMLGAVFVSIPKIIEVRAHAKLTESEFIGKETRGLIDNLKKQAHDAECILAYQVSLRHTIQSAYQASIWLNHDLIERLEEKGIKVKPLTSLDIETLLKNPDLKIIEIKNSKP